jgi:hypothetical protein
MLKLTKRSPKCVDCSGFGYIQAGCGNLKQEKGNALHVTLSDNSDNKETLGKDPNFLAFTASHNDHDESISYYSESSDDDDLKEVYKTLYLKFIKLREVNQMNVMELNLLQTKKNTFINKTKGLEDKLVAT